MSGYERLKSREVSRLCHFTKLQNLTHILATEDGIIASGSIQQGTKNVNDIARYDGEVDYVCCTIEYGELVDALIESCHIWGHYRIPQNSWNGLIVHGSVPIISILMNGIIQSTR